MAKIDWLQVKTEYLTTNATYEKLAEKYGASFSSIEKRARKEKWREEKHKTRKNIERKVREKTEEKIAVKIANRNEKFLEISDLALNAIEDYLKKEQYKKHLVKYKLYDEGKVYQEELVAEELDGVPDTKAFANMIASLEKVQKGQRLAEGLDKDDDDSEDSSGNLDQLSQSIKEAAEVLIDD